MDIKAVTKSIKYILKRLAIATVRQYYSWSPKINSKLFFECHKTSTTVVIKLY